LLQWKEDRSWPDEDRYEDHACDAFLYAYRECRHYLFDSEEELPDVGTNKWYEQKEQELVESLEKRILGSGEDEDEDLEEDHWWLHV
jgi:hypothetical protein